MAGPALAPRISGRTENCSRRSSAAAPAALLRLLQFSVLPEILGASAGPAIYLASKRFSSELDEERVLVKLGHCLSCQRLPAGGTAVCDFERGLVDGVLEGITGREVVTK